MTSNSPGSDKESPDNTNLAPGEETGPRDGAAVPEQVGSDDGAQSQRPMVWNRSPLAPRQQWLSRTWLTILSIVLTLAVCISITATYQNTLGDILAIEKAALRRAAQWNTEETVPIKVFYPSSDGLVPEERFVKASQIKIHMVESAVQEYLKGPSDVAVSYIPEGTHLLGLYHGSDGIVYLDLSHEFRSRFQGDAYGEFLLLRGLYESVMSNAENVSGLKILIEGTEVETVGGHISLKGTLGSVVSRTMMEGHEQK